MLLGFKGIKGFLAAGAVISGLVNIALVFYITNGWESMASEPPVVMRKENQGRPFAIEIYGENDIVSDAVQERGWESSEIAALNTHFQDYSSEHGIPLSALTFIDIGANFGWLSFNMAALGVNVLAFEPMESNIKHFKNTLRLRKNIESGISSRITLYEHGLGTKDETCFVYSDNTNVGDGHIQCAERASYLKIPANYSVRGRVPLKRLDDVVNTAGMNIVAVKMDTEGYEAGVLEGGRRVLLDGAVGVLIVEFQPAVMIEKGGDPVEFMKTVRNAGYKVERLSVWSAYKESDVYWNDTEVLDMSLVSSNKMLRIDSPNQQKANLAKQRAYRNGSSWANNIDGDYQDWSDYEYDGYPDSNGEALHQHEFEAATNSTNNRTYAHSSNGGEPFSIEMYSENDIVSDQVRQTLGSWEFDSLVDLNKNFKEYSKKHQIPLSNLTFIDIGANIGWLSFSMAALGVKVLAFEPMESNIKLFKRSLQLKTNIERNISSRITLYEHGLGTKDETCFVYSDNTNVGDGHIQCVEQESDLKIPTNYSVRGRVAVKRLDDVVNPAGMHIVAAKMDCEGYEGGVLKGGTKVLLDAGIEKIITEFKPDWFIEKGGDPVEFMKNMTEAGYRIPTKKWGYMRKRDMLNMSNFGSEDVTFHSRKLVDEFVNG